MAAGFQSLAKGASRHFEAGQVRQTVVEMEEAFHFVTAAGQGACMAVEDAAVLARCMEENRSASDAFQEFERKRIARTTNIVNKSWSIGKVAQFENPVLVALRNAAIKLTPPSVAEKQIKYLIRGI
mgnify:CR=1 FL=1